MQSWEQALVFFLLDYIYADEYMSFSTHIFLFYRPTPRGGVQ